MVYHADTFFNQYLEHHGIKGQKWGQQNGPPYPLNEKQLSKAEKKIDSNLERAEKYTEKYLSLKKKSANTALTAAKKDKSLFFKKWNARRAKTLRLRSARQLVKSNRYEAKARKLIENTGVMNKTLNDIAEENGLTRRELEVSYSKIMNKILNEDLDSDD